MVTGLEMGAIRICPVLSFTGFHGNVLFLPPCPNLSKWDLTLHYVTESWNSNEVSLLATKADIQLGNI